MEQAISYERIPTKIYANSDEASRSVALEIASIIRQKAGEGKPAVLGLATGPSPKKVYKELIRMHKEEGLSFQNVVTYNLEMTTSMDALVAQMNAILLANQKTFMLGEPLSLTVKRSNGGYSKRPHTGGEDFQALRCYAGKRDKLIYVFRPVDAVDYVEMEMDEAQAKKSLNRFADFLKTYAGSDFDRTRKEIAKKNAEEAELEKLATRKEYADLGFGSW